MKKLFTISTIALFCASLLLLIVTYGYHSSKAKENNNQSRQTDSIGAVTSVTCQKNAANTALTDIVLADAAGKTKTFGSYSNIYVNHYHCVEYHNGNVYIIRRVNYEGYPDPNNDWMDELWKINADKTEQKLYSVRGLDYRVAPDESAAVAQGPIEDKNIELINIVTKVIKSISKTELGITDNVAGIQFEGWSDNSDKFWGQLYNTEKPEYFSIAKQTGKVTLYDSPHNFHDEHVLNLNSGIVAYSEYPFLFDTETEQEYFDSKTKVNFYFYNLRTKEKTLIVTSVVKAFEPKWLNDITVEYNDPASGNRITYSLE